MFPERSQWRSWSPLEKATYVAQLAAPLALIITVVFSYLSWREAVEARRVSLEANRQSQRFFISQNPPKIELTRADVMQANGEPWIFFTFKNVGDSEARSPCIEIHGDLEVGSSRVITTSCEGGNPYRDRSVGRNETFSYQIPQSMVQVEGALRFAIWSPGDPPPAACKGPGSQALFFDIRYSDVTGERRERYQQAFLCSR